MDVYWGLTNKLEHAGKKRKISSSYDEDDIKLVHTLIYRIDNEFHFGTEVNKITIEILIKLMTEHIENYYKKNTKSKELKITYIVDTPGGLLSATFKFIDFINLIKTKYRNIKFVSVITGLVASAGTLMSVCADTKLITKGSSVMIHELSAGRSDKYTQLLSHTAHILDLHRRMIEVYQEHCNEKITKEDLELLLKNETWYNAEDYKKIGFVDKVC